MIRWSWDESVNKRKKDRQQRTFKNIALVMMIIGIGYATSAEGTDQDCTAYQSSDCTTNWRNLKKSLYPTSSSDECKQATIKYKDQSGLEMEFYKWGDSKCLGAYEWTESECAKDSISECEIGALIVNYFLRLHKLRNVLPKPNFLSLRFMLLVWLGRFVRFLWNSLLLRLWGL